MNSRLIFISAIGLCVAACSGGDRKIDNSACSNSLPCGFFDIAKPKESSPILFGSAATKALYRICVQDGSVIVQTMQGDGRLASLGSEVRSGNCADIAVVETNYIIGNTADGHSSGFYYRVP